MKKTCTLFMLIACTIGSYAQAWTKIKPAFSTKQLEDVFFISPVKGWAVGAQGTILTTNDGGNTWDSITSPLGLTHLFKVQFTSPTKGWIVGSNDTILTTDNAGATWTKVPLPSTGDQSSMHFITPDTGYLVGGNGTAGVCKRTYNGGATWVVTNVATPLSAVQFVNHRVGYACGYRGAIYRTTNAGVTWVEQKPMGANITHNLGCIFMLSAAEGWIGGNPANLYYTIDSGNTWLTRASGTNAGKTALHFFDSGNAWVATTSSLGGAKPLRSTIDTCKTWVIDTIFTSSVYAMAFSGDTLGWAVGENGIILRMGTPPAVTPSGIKAVSNNPNIIKAYPNPTSNTLNITSTFQVERYTVTNLLGETMLIGEPDNGLHFQLNTTALPRGTYLVCTHAQGKQYFTRFVRN